MDRRAFSQLLTLGAAGLTVGHANGEAAIAAEDAEEGIAPAAGVTGDLPSSAVAVDDFIELARRNLPKATFEYITSGSEDEVTLRDNVDAFRRIRVLPPLLHGIEDADLSTTVLGQKISMPIMLAPVAVLRMAHPQGALAAARAAAEAGTIHVAGSSAGHSLEEIAEAADGPKWLQIYVPADRDIASRLVRRAEQAGYRAIVVTVDLGERKDADLRNRFAPPKEMLLKHLRDIGFTQLTEQNTYDEILAFNASAWRISLDAEFFEWLRKTTSLPILIKGVLSPQAAKQAIELGLNGLVVSNHGGRRLDGMPATIDVLENVVEAVDGRLEVLMDGGIRRGGDVLKAVARGAKAVLIGRPQAWALAAGGQAGVAQALQILRDELTNAMVSCGCSKVEEIDASLLMS
ncbi:MAG: alpha-hydroxy-acid oxidizing protein [Planctomycetota bacterium]|nr:MAG: alpha-hydroxy-acid oxidizing protein [Planctomycetota bacterium]REK39872.1 MAG: alpha-hydroxy-acid oxidizing protein [Planctomycetota bacterium]